MKDVGVREGKRERDEKKVGDTLTYACFIKNSVIKAYFSLSNSDIQLTATKITHVVLNAPVIFKRL